MTDAELDGAAVAEELNRTPAERRRHFFREMLADLAPDPWLDLQDLVNAESGERDDDGFRDEC